MSTLYMQRSRKDGDRGAWTEGVTSTNRLVILANIFETITRKHHLTDEEELDAQEQLKATGSVHVDTTTYDIREFEEGEPQDSDAQADFEAYTR
jgi:hypothetical protein